MPRLAKEPSAAQLAAREAGAARLRAAREKRLAPVIINTQKLDTSDAQVGQDHPREMSSTGKAKIDPPTIELVEGPVPKEKLDALAFNEEILTILVHDSTNVSDEPVPYVMNGGKRQAFIRGQEQPVRRKYVEVLARMKRQTFTQERYKDSQGIDAIRNIPHTALVYPFQVVHDPNPNGKAWLQKILAEA